MKARATTVPLLFHRSILINLAAFGLECALDVYLRYLYLEHVEQQKQQQKQVQKQLK